MILDISNEENKRRITLKNLISKYRGKKGTVATI